MAPGADAGGLHWRHRRLVAGVSLIMIAAPMAAVTFTFTGPSVAGTFHAGLSEVMLAFSVMTLTNALSMTWMSRHVARWGARRVIITGGAWSSLMLLAYSVATQLWQFYLISFGLGLTLAVSIGLSSSILVREWFVDRQATVQGLVQAMTGFTGLLLGLVLPGVIAVGGWQGAYRVIAALLFCLTVIPGVFLVRSRPESVGLLAFGASPTPADAPALVPDGVVGRRALRTAHFWVLLAVIVTTAGVQTISQHMRPLGVSFGLDLAGVGWVLALQSVVAVVLQMAAGFAADRYGLVTTSAVCLGLQALACLLLLLARGPMAFTVSMVLVAAGMCVATLMVPIFVIEVFGARSFAGILGPMMAAMPGGLALGAPLWGLDHDLTGSYRLGLVVAIAASVLTGVAIAWLLRTAPAMRARLG